MHDPQSLPVPYMKVTAAFSHKNKTQSKIHEKLRIISHESLWLFLNRERIEAIHSCLFTQGHYLLRNIHIT